jgi:DNA/RNA-binding domain of Phe-tRNA-synthetase-like protein
MEGAGVSGEEPTRLPSEGRSPGPAPAYGTDAATGFELDLGWCSKEVEEELPQLRLALLTVGLAQSGSIDGRSLSASSPPSVLARLRELSNRFRGARAVGVRREPVPAAYRIFYRQIGLDPDLSRTPIEAAVLERMLRGGFLSGGLLDDVLLIALLDTGVPVWAVDTGAVDGVLGVRVSREGEPLGRARDAQALPAGRLVLADGSAALGLLFGELARGARPGARTRELTLFAVQVPGVPMLYVEEALWICHNSLERAG